MTFLRLLTATLLMTAACARNGLDASGAVPVDDPTDEDADAAVPDADGSVAPPGDDGTGSPQPPAPEPEACAVLEATGELTRLPVDIVWVVDDSGSMLDEQARIRENIAAFAQRITGAGIDVRVVFVTDDDLAENTALAGQPSYLFVESRVGSNEGLEVLLEEEPTYAAHLRPDAATHFVAVTDDESDLDAASFQSQMEAKLGHGFTFHAIASENVGGRACRCSGALLGCGAAAPGDEYYALAATTGGEQVSICTADWGGVFDRLSNAVIAGSALPCSFALPAPPAGEALDPDRVTFDFVDTTGAATEIPRLINGECGLLVAWSYDDARTPKSIELCPQACKSLEAGGSVRVSLGCAPSVVQ